jgi:branched-chain amino acid aminotransferase
VLWHEGAVHDDHRARLDFADRGLILGDGLFETMVVLEHRVFRLGDHLDRLLAGAQVLRLPLDRARLMAPVAALAARAPGGAGIIRLTVTRGPGPRGLKPPPQPQPTVFAMLAPWQLSPALPQASLATATLRRNPTSPLTQLKSLAYLDNILALDEAVSRGADDALLLTTDNRVACASAANVFAIRDRALATPPVEDAILPGITRRLVLALAPAIGLAPREVSLSVGDLAGADAVFTTNSVALAVNVTRINEHALPEAGRKMVDALRRALIATIEAECTAGGAADMP